MSHSISAQPQRQQLYAHTRCSCSGVGRGSQPYHIAITAPVAAVAARPPPPLRPRSVTYLEQDLHVVQRRSAGPDGELALVALHVLGDADIRRLCRQEWGSAVTINHTVRQQRRPCIDERPPHFLMKICPITGLNNIHWTGPLRLSNSRTDTTLSAGP